MQIVESYDIIGLASNTWSDSVSNRQAGPGTFVWFVRAPTFTAAMSLDVRVGLTIPVLGDCIIDATTATAGSAGTYPAGFQSQPVPLLGDTWFTWIMVRHAEASAQPFNVRLLKL